MKRVRLIISGRVQGVFYRAAVRDIAARYPVTGFVRNLPNGTVEVVAEGPEPELRRFAAECKINDGIREAEKMETSYSSIPSRQFKYFSIRY